MANAKGKGSSFERQVSKDLSRWISDGERSDLFWRSSQSGGRATIMYRKGENAKSQVGDLSAIDYLGMAFMQHFSIECKHYKTLDLHQIPLNQKGNFCNHWRKAKKEAEQHGKSCMMISKQNHLDTLLVLDTTGYELMRQTSFGGVKLHTLVRATVPPLRMRIFLYKEFLATVNPSIFREM